MTNAEAVIAVAGVSVDALLIEKALIDLNMTSTGWYDVLDGKTIDLAAIEVLKGIIAMADITEGGYSIKYDRSAILKRITALGIKNGIAEYLTVPKVRAVNVW